MDFHYDLYATKVTERNSRNEFEGEDDEIFYAEVRRQILQLMTDDDDQDGNDFWRNDIYKKSMKTEKQMLNISSAGIGLPGSSFLSWSEKESENSVPKWLLNLWRSNGNGTGTGVFIPCVAHSQRRNKSRRKNKEKGKVYKPVANKNM